MNSPKRCVKPDPLSLRHIRQLQSADLPERGEMNDGGNHRCDSGGSRKGYSHGFPDKTDLQLFNLRDQPGGESLPSRQPQQDAK